MEQFTYKLNAFDTKSALVYNHASKQYYFVDLGRGCAKAITLRETMRLSSLYRAVTEPLAMMKQANDLIACLSA